MARKGKFGTVDITVLGNELRIGDKAPDFYADKMDLTPYNFYDEEENKIKILSVVPSLDTDVCELQTKMFQKATDSFSDNIVVVTVSNDLPFAQLRFKANKKTDKIKFVSDYNQRDFSSKYGTLIEELKLLNRSVFVVDKDNTIKYVQYLEQNTDLPEYEEAIKIARDLDR
ncbi:redoxin family protein [Anaerococcus lactolyticus ATCC 51172]|uniref:Redoxin family protein n=1 Tax=Anaerococcus lactolyticus ATCC 51172 TaxID=525254 RepID=C2BII9_9FIRM|nr:thiol peroxidase [Anaerococcus lactolyticus]EEI85241.1 redoxin family protein [Anaerococcus lactolyticus ATCC 51172]